MIETAEQTGLTLKDYEFAMFSQGAVNVSGLVRSLAGSRSASGSRHGRAGWARST